MKWLQVKLSDDMHFNFKRKCLEDKKEMSTLIREWVKNYLTKVQ